jgi:L-threonylcarbamoyladenylate synthase
VQVIGRVDLARCRTALDAGELVVLPTRRWYMLCADSGDPAACDRIFNGKRRTRSKPLVLVMPTNSAVTETFVLNDAARRLAEALWPGDLALVLARRDPQDESVCGAVGTPHALVTRDPGVLGELAGLTRRPLATAVVSNSSPGDAPDPGPAITIADVEIFVTASGLSVAFAVDGGICPAARHLTIVDCTGPIPRITRTGEVHERAVTAALAA